jgi:hypothetical protein
MEAAAKDARREPAMFRALLDAVLYAHVPADDKTERTDDEARHVRLMMFKSPDDGTLVIPVFTDEGKAKFASGGVANVLAVTGRELFEATRGATLMLNPNDVKCTLYPAEISALLANSTLAPVTKGRFEEDQARLFRLTEVPAPLVKALKEALPAVPSIELAYIAGVRWRDPERPESVLIALGSSAGREDREARATAVAMQSVIDRLHLPVDIIHFDAHDAPPGWIAHLGLKPVYRRRPLPITPSRYN